MKKYVSALALAALVGAPAAQALDTTFGGEYELNGYSVDLGDGTAAGADDEAAFQQLLRVKAHFKTDSGVQINTRLNVVDSVWDGDNHAGTDGTAFSDTASDGVTVDYGYVVVPLGNGFSLTTGRTESNWGNCFLTCDDRRDRILVLGKLGSVTVGAGYDKRVEGTLNADDDRDMYQALAIGTGGGWLWGVAAAVFTGDNTVLKNVKLVSPYVKGKLGPVTLEGGYIYLGGGDDVSVYSDPGHSAFLRVGSNFGIVGIEAQAVATRDGGLMSSGFDTFSSLISNNPNNNQSPTSVLTMGGGLGSFVSEQYDETLYAARLTVSPISKLKLIGAAGQYSLDRGAVGALPAVDDSATFYDVQAQYALTDDTTMWATYGQLKKADFTADDISAMSLNLRTTF